MPDFKTPQLIITDVGLAAAQVATPTGPFIEIGTFKIGSAYGYTPTRADTDINGELLFEGPPLTYKYIGDNTLDIVCRLPAEAGPFEFGEVGLFLTGGAMFAKAAFDTLQVKYSSLGTNVLSTYTFNCLLRLDQAVAVFKINTNCLPPDIWEVDLWSDVYPAGLSANPTIPSILVHELDFNGNASLITRGTDEHWSHAGNYRVVGTSLVTASTTTSVTLAAASLPNVVDGTLDKEYVIQTDDGYLRSVHSQQVQGPNIVFNLNPEPLPVAPPVGSRIEVASAQTTQTKLNLTGGATGSAVIKGQTVNLNVSIDRGALLARSITYDVAGTYTFIVPDGVQFLYVDGGGAGGGGGGAGGGWPTQNWPYSLNPAQPPNPDGTNTYWGYRAGGGAGGGGAGETRQGLVLNVTSGETVTVVIGKGGAGGTGGAPGVSGTSGVTGTATTLSGSFGTVVIPGGTGGGNGADNGGGNTGAGGPGGVPGGIGGIDGAVGAAGGPGGTSAFGAGGSGGRGATSGPGQKGAPGQPGSGNSSGGGGGGSIYLATQTDSGGDGASGTDGFCNITW